MQGKSRIAYDDQKWRTMWEGLRFWVDMDQIMYEKLIKDLSQIPSKDDDESGQGNTGIKEKNKIIDQKFRSFMQEQVTDQGSNQNQTS